MRAVMEIVQHKEAIKIGLMQAEMQKRSQSPHLEERLPLRAEGDDFARVEARIPKDLFFHLVKQRNFGVDGFCDDGGMEDFLKTHPSCRVKTVSGKTVVGYAGKGQSQKRERAAIFGRGTIELAR